LSYCYIFPWCSLKFSIEKIVILLSFVDSNIVEENSLGQLNGQMNTQNKNYKFFSLSIFQKGFAENQL